MKKIREKITFKKKGNVILTMLLFIMLMMILTALIFSFLTSVESSRKAQKAAQIIAETRALAIDVRLKERYGYVEIIHEDKDYNGVDYEYITKFPEGGEPRYDVVEQGYENAVLSPDNELYKKAVKFADDAAKEAGLAYIDGVTKDGENSEGGSTGTKLLDVEPENICIRVISLPDAEVERKKLKCGPITTPSPTPEILAEVETGDSVPIYGSRHRLNGFTGEDNEISNSIHNYNFVFVLLTYQEKTFFYKAIQRFAHGEDESKWTAPPIRTVWSIAYPQIDFCVGGDC